MNTRNLQRLAGLRSPGRLRHFRAYRHLLRVLGGTLMLALALPSGSADAADIDFGVVEIGSSSERSAKPITTMGTVEVYSVVITGGDEGDFTILEDT